MQKVRLRQARRHRKTLRTMQGKASTILERPQEGRRRSRRRVAGGDCRWEDAEEIIDHFAGVGKMILNDGDNRLILIAREMKSAPIGAWINM